MDRDQDPDFFRCEVQPVLDNRCSMLECHGDEDRPFRVYSRNRLRLEAESIQRNLAMTSTEIEINADNAAEFDADPHEDAFLVRKPLVKAAGGYFHDGRELYASGDVFDSTDDPDFQILLRWLEGEVGDPACVYAGTEEPAGGTGG